MLDQVLYGNSLWRWLAAAALAAGAYGAMRLLQGVTRRHLVHLTRRTASNWDDLLVHLVDRRTHALFFLAMAVYAGTLALQLPERAQAALRGLAVAAFFAQAAWWANGAIGYWFGEAYRRQQATDPDSASAYYLLSLLSRVALWSVVVLAVLHNLGINITALATGLGVAGVAVALAVQNILGDLFASLSILLDKPFVVGDFIIVGDYMGTVEHIGIKTTRVRSLGGEQIVFSNADLLGSRIRNYKRMYERRVLFQVGVTYSTPHQKLERIPTILREIVEAQQEVRFDRAHFARYGDFALIFEVVYYVLRPDYNFYMDVQQAINLAIYRRFAEEGIKFAFPTQTIYLARSWTAAQEPLWPPVADQTSRGATTQA
ncbi:MAG TPA: mechanosensitive ion channel family protein [Limnochordales bacterium]